MPYLPQRNPDGCFVGWLFSLFSQARAGVEDPVCHQLRWSLPNGKSHGNHMEIIWKSTKKCVVSIEFLATSEKANEACEILSADRRSPGATQGMGSGDAVFHAVFLHDMY